MIKWPLSDLTSILQGCEAANRPPVEQPLQTLQMRHPRLRYPCFLPFYQKSSRFTSFHTAGKWLPARWSLIRSSRWLRNDPGFRACIPVSGKTRELNLLVSTMHKPSCSRGTGAVISSYFLLTGLPMFDLVNPFFNKTKGPVSQNDNRFFHEIGEFGCHAVDPFYEGRRTTGKSPGIKDTKSNGRRRGQVSR